MTLVFETAILRKSVTLTFLFEGGFMHNLTSGFSFSNSLTENQKRRNVEQRRKDLASLNLRIGGVIKTSNGVEVIADFDNALAQIKTFSGRQYEPVEIIKVG